MFKRSLDLITACSLVHVHVFPYSPRPGTPAARMPQLPRALVKERAQRLREHGRHALRRRFDREIGARRWVLIEPGGCGYTEHFLPLTLPQSAQPGSIVGVSVEAHDGHRLIGARSCWPAPAPAATAVA
jgi:threonylcarbamoyladenosine tRNA methylthiotransferase MtaB